MKITDKVHAAREVEENVARIREVHRSLKLTKPGTKTAKQKAELIRELYARNLKLTAALMKQD